ncbi:ASPIC/UnbV domain-containing protein [Pedobacter steynii]
MGNKNKIDSISAVWQSGKKQVLTNVKPDPVIGFK